MGTSGIFVPCNPFKMNGIFHSYQLDQFISVLRIVENIFHLYSNFDRTFWKQTVETLIGCRRMSDLGLHCLPFSHKKDARLIWVNMDFFLIDISGGISFDSCKFSYTTTYTVLVKNNIQ